jgi:hypothetical protein
VRHRPFIISAVGLSLLVGFGAAPLRAGADEPPRNVCPWGLTPRGFRALFVPSKAKVGRARAVATARRLATTVGADRPLRELADDLAALLLLGEQLRIVDSPWHIEARTGRLVPKTEGSTIGRHGEEIVARFPGGADFRLDIRALAFQGTLTELRLAWSGDHPRLALTFARPIDVARMGMSDERACDVVELRYEEP